MGVPQPVQDRTNLLRQYAAEIRSLKSQTAELLVRIGQRLLMARKLCKRTDWPSFLLEADLSPATARRFMRIAEAFGNDVPNVPVGRLDTIVKTLARAEDRRNFLDENNVSAMAPAEFAEALERYRQRAERAERRVAQVEKAVLDAPAKVIEANVALRRVDAAIAQCVEAIHGMGDGDLDPGVLKSVRERTERLFALLMEKSSG